MPRLVRIPREKQIPTHLQGVSRFRCSGEDCRCVVPGNLLLAAPEVLRGLHEIQCSLDRVLYYVEAYCTGTIGVNQHMRTVAQAMSHCWNWEHLLQNPARLPEHKAFLKLAGSLHMSLQHTERPSGAEFKFVGRWPKQKGANGLHEQYKTLIQRVRAVGRSKRKSQSWWQVSRVTVEPVHAYGDPDRVFFFAQVCGLSLMAFRQQFAHACFRACVNISFMNSRATQAYPQLARLW